MLPDRYPSHHTTSRRRTVLFLSLLVFTSSTFLYYFRVRWTQPIQFDPFSSSGSPTLDQADQPVIIQSINCSSPVMSDPGIHPGGKTQFKQGWRELPPVHGSTLDTRTFRVGNGVLTSYVTSHFDPQRIKRVVVMIHGLHRTSWNQQIYTTLALDKASRKGQISREEVVVVSPHFFTTKDAGAFPADANGRPQCDALIWRGNDWADGAPSAYPRGSSVGAFDALDAVIDHFLNVDQFPRGPTVVIAGFSLGGQLVNRYSTFRPYNPHQEERVSFWISSPNSFVYLDRHRPYSTKGCGDFNQYKYGLEGDLPLYLSTKGIQPSIEYLAPNLLRRRIAYAVGSEDFSAGNDICAAAVQGAHHVSKMKHWVEDYLPFLPGSTGCKGVLPPRSTFDVVKGAAHQDYKVIQSECAIQRLFLEGDQAGRLEQGGSHVHGVRHEEAAPSHGPVSEGRKGGGLKEKMKAFFKD